MKIVFMMTRSATSRLKRALPACGLSLLACACGSHAGGMPLVRAPPACAGGCLSGRDPYDSGCADDAATVARGAALDSAGKVVAYVDLRRSARCGTGWARAVRAAGAQGTLAASVTAGGLSSSFEHATDGEVWTDMVPSSGRDCVAATGGIRVDGEHGVDVKVSSCATSMPVHVASQ